MPDPQTATPPAALRDCLRLRVARLEEVKRLLDVEQIETDFLYQPEGARDPVVLYWGAIDEWVDAAIREATEQLQRAEVVHA